MYVVQLGERYVKKSYVGNPNLGFCEMTKEIKEAEKYDKVGDAVDDVHCYSRQTPTFRVLGLNMADVVCEVRTYHKGKWVNTPPDCVRIPLEEAGYVVERSCLKGQKWCVYLKKDGPGPNQSQAEHMDVDSLYYFGEKNNIPVRRWWDQENLCRRH